jgi:hypothetical protein
MSGRHEVFQSRQPGIEFNILENTGYPHRTDLIRQHLGNLDIIEKYSPFLRPIKRIDAIKDASFAGAVGTNNGQYLPWSNTEAYSL